MGSELTLETNKEYGFLEYFKCDPNWKKKAGKICGLIVFYILSIILSAVPLLGLIFFPIAFAFMACIMGYFAINSNLRILKPRAGIYEFDLKKSFLTGIKLMGGMFCISIVAGILGAIVSIPISVLKIDSLTNMFLFIMQLLGAAYATAATISFQIDLKFKSVMDVRRVILIIKKNPTAFVITLLKLYALCIVAGLIGILSVITIVGPIFIGTYAGYLGSEIQAQYVRDSFKIIKKEQ